MTKQDVVHYPGCTANYPEKPKDEPPQHIMTVDLGGGFTAYQCSDCGAQVNDLPPMEDPYWHDVREQ